MIKQGRIRLKDIAEATGYTINTVSHALNDKDDISEQTKQVIREAAQKMGYISDLMAGALRSGLSRTIAIILADISNPFFSIKVKEINRELRAHNYSAIIIDTDEDVGMERSAVQSAISRNADGIIICPTQKDTGVYDLLRQVRIPYVLLSRHENDETMSSVVWDDCRGGFLATDYLLKRGKRRILFLNGPDYISSSSERLEGYRQALRASGVPYIPQLVVKTGVISHGGVNALEQVFQQNISFDAIFVFSDFIAMEAMSMLGQRGIRVPEEIPVVGFDDLQSHLYLPVPLVSVGADTALEAKTVVEILMGQINGTCRSVRREIIPTYITEHHLEPERAAASAELSKQV